ncbi:hypothetical protein BS47DRAFT_1382761 [Hydnum rufescens UP504]|uniref:Uncharacterized protein n=1 Tax=Hydnum rufescens UP504 TaxID=1448309 RepID=A0A9P6AVQ1_9AGAM|nr:hypothetical protein BS47DRAFT_1382761 [Hydnum rufescens UP504]
MPLASPYAVWISEIAMFPPRKGHLVVCRSAEPGNKVLPMALVQSDRVDRGFMMAARYNSGHGMALSPLQRVLRLGKLANLSACLNPAHAGVEFRLHLLPECGGQSPEVLVHHTPEILGCGDNRWEHLARQNKDGYPLPSMRMDTSGPPLRMQSTRMFQSKPRGAPSAFSIIDLQG